MKSTEKYKRAILPKCNCGQDEAEYAWDWANQLENSLRQMLDVVEPADYDWMPEYEEARKLLSDNTEQDRGVSR